MENDILFLEPVFKEPLWGGTRLKDEFGYDIPSSHTGECWAVSAHENGNCKIKSGIFYNLTLSELWKSHRELFGNMEQSKFPLLVKIIDAKENLSIQVHPNDEYAQRHENGSLGKMECWYVLNCAENATIVIGHNAKTKEELKSMIQNHQWEKLIREIPIKKGDFFQIDPGTVHAIKGGTLILETQQNSDITYRVYDYDRLMNGKPRELHLQKSMDVIQVPYKETVYPAPCAEASKQCKTLISSPYYCVQKWKIEEPEAFEQSKPFMIMSVIDGSGTINGRFIQKGDHFILPYKYGTVALDGHLQIISSYCPLSPSDT